MNGDVNHDDHDDPPCALINALSGWWRWEELNLRHGAYETPALPLSYTADPRKVDQLQDEILPQTPRSCPKTCPNRACNEIGFYPSCVVHGGSGDRWTGHQRSEACRWPRQSRRGSRPP